MRVSPTPHRRRSPWPAVAVAAALAACAVVVQRQSRAAERRFPPRGRFVAIDGARLHVSEHGRADAAQTVVMLHGDRSMAAELELSGLVDKAAERYRVLVFDRPGHGHSDPVPDVGPEAQAERIAAALERLGVVRPIVFGHSWGALVAIALALRRPEAVGALVLAGGYYFPTLRPSVAGLALPALPLIGPLLAHTVGPLLMRALWGPMTRRVFSPALPTPAFVQRFPVWLALRPSALRAAAAENASLLPAARALRDRYHRLAVPAVVVAGADDRYVSTLWHSCRLHELLDRSWLRVIEGGGHMVHHVAPGQVMAAIDQAAAMGPAETYPPLATDRSGEEAHVAPAADAMVELGRS